MPTAEKFLPHYTIDDYFMWEGDWELIYGIPYAMAPSPTGKHQRIVSILIRQIEEQLEKCPENCYVYHELDWIVSTDTVIRPDIVVICKKIEDYIKSPPEVVFEVISKSTALKDENLKFQLYEREKVKYYALVYPELKKMRVFKLKNNKYEKVFDGESGTFTFEIECEFSVDLDKIWKRM